jgi:hypothetical protein
VLTIDMTHVSHQELADTLARYSSLFGAVTEVKVHPTPSAPTMRPYALITMGSRKEAERLAVAFGGRTIGRVVIVALQELEHTSAPAQGEAARSP